ncbi:hypothetical protein Tco_1396479 [Tanacetum coccineum]
MASLDYRSNPLSTFKECSSCGALYNKTCACSKGGFVGKFVRDPNKTLDLSQRPPHNCPNCGDPVDGLYCQQCALLRKKLREIFDENEFFQDLLNPFESSNDKTNVVNLPQESFVFNQDPGANSSQSPPHIDHHYCYECGDSLDDIFCQRCTCKSCGNGAHYGYNCPPKVPIISNPEPCNNQTVDELPQTLPSFDPTCYSGDGNSFTYDSTPNFVNDSPNVFNPPPQPQYVPYSCELCGNDAHHGYDCPPQVPFVYNQDPCFNQNFDYFPQTSPSFPQQYPCCEDCGGPHETFQCQPMNYYEPNPCYDSNYSGFDQFQPPQYTVNHPIFNAQNELLNSQNEIMEQMTSICDMVGQYMQKKEEDKRIAEDQAAKDRYWKIPICYFLRNNINREEFQEIFRKLHDDVQNIHEELAEYINTPNWNRPIVYYDDDDEDYTIAITPVLSTKEPIDSLIMENEHIDTILATESNKAIKSNQFEGFSDSNDDSTSVDDDSFSIDDINYVEASPPLSSSA